MNGNSLLLDTNIIIYLLSGDNVVSDIVTGKSCFLSFVSELELLSYHDLKESEQSRVRSFLKSCTIVDINEEIKKEAVRLRRQYKIRLPDSIILATGYYLKIPLLTSDKQLRKLKDVNLIYYDK